MKLFIAGNVKETEPVLTDEMRQLADYSQMFLDNTDTF